MKKAMVVLSGGQDSATCCAWAHTMFDEFETISFDYGQKHKKELECAADIARICGAASHTVIDIPALADNPMSALTNKKLNMNEVDSRSGLPKSFVPGRNLVFLVSAASIAVSKGIIELVTGVCQTDYSGYPDCRRETIDALEMAIRLGNAGLVTDFQIHTPLMYLTKAETVLLSLRLPLGKDAVKRSWTCYEGGDVPCGVCPACKLRIKGFMEAGVEDPGIEYWTSYKEVKEIL
jgi:7-cyano-7-deazaguanine synthase